MNAAAPSPARLLIDGPLVRVRCCRHGLMAYLVRDAWVGRSFDVYGEYGFHEVAAVLAHLPKGGVAIDAGANIGALTVPMALKAGPAGRVIAFEPQGFCFQVLATNLVLNQLAQVELHRAALADRPDQIDVPRLDPAQTNNFGGLSLDGCSNVADHKTGLDTVPVETIDALDLPRLDLLKADVEGMEEAVIEGARSTIARCRPVLYLEADRPDRRPSLIATIEALGYVVHAHNPPLFNPANFAGEPRNVFGAVVSINLLCIPKERLTHDPAPP